MCMYIYLYYIYKLCIRTYKFCIYTCKVYMYAYKLCIHMYRYKTYIYVSFVYICIFFYFCVSIQNYTYILYMCTYKVCIRVYKRLYLFDFGPAQGKERRTNMCWANMIWPIKRKLHMGQHELDKKEKKKLDCSQRSKNERVNLMHAIANVTIQINAIIICLFVAAYIFTKLKPYHHRQALHLLVRGTHPSDSSSSSIYTHFFFLLSSFFFLHR